MAESTGESGSRGVAGEWFKPRVVLGSGISRTSAWNKMAWAGLDGLVKVTSSQTTRQRRRPGLPHPQAQWR